MWSWEVCHSVWTSSLDPRLARAVIYELCLRHLRHEASGVIVMPHYSCSELLVAAPGLCPQVQPRTGQQTLLSLFKKRSMLNLANSHKQSLMTRVAVVVMFFKLSKLNTLDISDYQWLEKCSEFSCFVNFCILTTKNQCDAKVVLPLARFLKTQWLLKCI